MSNEEVNRIMKERFESEDKIRVSLAAERSHVLERERRKHHHELNELEQDRNQLRNQVWLMAPSKTHIVFNSIIRLNTCRVLVKDILLTLLLNYSRQRSG
uniref:Uncharacterized protein n=1 Tax=Spongospora subterranea TaxID=70186 RepID=A0A0H5QQY8_9EUKA|eukprot:CRZ04047.1 hypothetical protein [Spongospora subterranea]